jgi:hypothetical protein
MPGIQYHVHFANGDTHVAETLEAARLKILQETDHDSAPNDLLPAEVWEVGPNDVGAGRSVQTVRQPSDLY